MAIVQTVDNYYQFEQAFKDANRSDNFTYRGQRILFDWLEAYSEDTGENVELDVVALCCDYREESAESIAADYRVDLSEIDDILDADDEEKREALTDVVRRHLIDNTGFCGEYTQKDDKGIEQTFFVFQCF